MNGDYGAWGRYNDQLAGPPGADFTGFFQGLLPPGAQILEVGVGSGRLALPLARAGFTMHGIDSSEDMLALLKEADPQGTVTAWHADITDDPDLDSYDAVLLAYNVLSMMPTRQDQQRCLAAAARKVRPRGFLVVENVAPRAVLSQLNERNQVLGVQFRDNNVWLNLGRYYPTEERFLVRYLAFEDRAFVQRSGDLTLINPEQVREMAAQNGLDLTCLAEDWNGAAFTTSSDQFVMTFQRPLLPPAGPSGGKPSADERR